MVAKVKAEVERYGLDPKFERAVTALVCVTPGFYGCVGHEVQVDRLGDEVCRLAWQAVHAIAEDTGKGPDRSVVVVQRLRRWVNEGKVTLEQVRAVTDMLDTAEDVGLPSVESATAELVPVLKRQIEGEVMRATVEQFASRGGEWDGVKEMLARSDRLGRSDVSAGITFGQSAFEVIKRMRHLARMPTGVTELDAALDGGAFRGTLSTVIGGPGGGKSMFLEHVTTNAMCLGQTVAVATLELPEPVWIARIAANLTGLTINQLLDGSMDEAQALLEQQERNLGRCCIKYFTAGVTSISDIRQWVQGLEQSWGVPVEDVVVDYGDKLRTASGKKKDAPKHEMMDAVFEEYRVWMEQTAKWGWTASQGTRGDKRRKVLDLDDVAEAMGKVRVSDLVCTLNTSEDQSETSILVAKNRLGRARMKVGPLPTDFAHGRFVPIARGEKPADADAPF